MAGSPAGSRGSVGLASVVLTHAQILVLPTVTAAAVVIVPAPGSGRMVMPLEATFSADCSAGAYTNFAASVPTDAYASSVYLVWDAPTNYNDATAPILASPLLGGAARKVSTVSGGWASFKNVNALADNSATEFGGSGATASGWENTALHVVGQNNVAGNFTGGNAANTLKVSVLYMTVDV